MLIHACNNEINSHHISNKCPTNTGHEIIVTMTLCLTKRQQYNKMRFQHQLFVGVVRLSQK